VVTKGDLVMMDSFSLLYGALEVLLSDAAAGRCFHWTSSITHCILNALDHTVNRDSLQPAA